MILVNKKPVLKGGVDVCVYYTGYTGNLPTQTYWFKSEFMNLCEELWGSDLGAFPSLNQCLNYSGAILETCPESKILNDVKMRQAKR